MNPTSDRFFLDTNILIYLYSENEPDKQSIAVGLLRDADVNYVISTQVIGEFANTMIRKYKCDIDSVRLAIDDFKSNFELAIIRSETIDYALKIIERYRFSYWDSVIISSALENECSVLYSEDLHHQQRIEGNLTTINPFL